MEETNQNTSDKKLEEQKEKIKELIRCEKDVLKSLMLMKLLEVVIVTPGRQIPEHLKSTWDEVNKSKAASNALLDCANSLKGLSLKNKVFILEILIYQLLTLTERKALESLVAIDTHLEMQEILQLPKKQVDIPSLDKSNIESFEELIDTALQLRFNEEEQ